MFYRNRSNDFLVKSEQNKRHGQHKFTNEILPDDGDDDNRDR